MIRLWELAHYPSEVDAARYRLSLWADSADVVKIRSLYPGRVGAVWVPKREPYSSAFFIYGVTPEEKSHLEQILSGTVEFPSEPQPFLPVQSVGKKHGGSSTQEVLLMEAIAATGTGVGEQTQDGPRVIHVGYFVPEHLPTAGDQVHAILSRTVSDKKISIQLEKAFSYSYGTLALPEIYSLLQKCQEHGVARAIAIGDPSRMHAFHQIGQKCGVFVKLLPESVIDKNLWLALMAELAAFEAGRPVQ